MNGTMALLALFIVLFPGVDWWIANWKPANFVPRLSLFSATFAFTETGSIRLGNFWTCMGIVNGLAWLSLGLASACAPKSWQEKAIACLQTTPSARCLRSRKSSGSAATVARRTSNALARAPDQGLGKSMRIVIASGTGLYVLLLVSSSDFGAANAGMALVALMVLACAIWVASQASRFFSRLGKMGRSSWCSSRPFASPKSWKDTGGLCGGCSCCRP
jgi:hypothetical protein